MTLRRLTPLLLVLALLTLLAGCGGGDERPDDEQVRAAVSDYARAFGEGDGKRACALLTSGARDAFTKRVSTLVGTDDCAEAVTKLQAVAWPSVTGPFRDATVDGVEVTGDTAKARLEAGTGTTEVTIEQQGGDWLLTKVPGTY